METRHGETSATERATERIPPSSERGRPGSPLSVWMGLQSGMDFELAGRRRLTFEVERSFRRRFGGCDTFNFGDLTENHLNLPSLRSYLDEEAL